MELMQPRAQDHQGPPATPQQWGQRLEQTDPQSFRQDPTLHSLQSRENIHLPCFKPPGLS